MNDVYNDNPIQKIEDDEFGRASYAQVIADTIISAKEGFNFGISGKWGAGKSSVLKLLKPILENEQIQVLEFSPWKFAQDKSSIRRKFLADIRSQIGFTNPDEKLYETVTISEPKRTHEKLKLLFELGTDWLFYLVMFSSVVLLILAFLKYLAHVDLEIWESFSKLFAIPAVTALFPFFGHYLTEIKVEKKVPQVESAEQFEKEFSDAISKACENNPDKKVVIFIDDLDRCSPNEVMEVLAALFTFFGDKRCTYIVSADHTVIERYAGQALAIESSALNDGGADRTELGSLQEPAGKEYLKKIFQINWIIPEIPPDRIKGYIEKLLPTEVTETGIPYVRDYIVAMAQRLFERNPRKIKYFLRSLVFQLAGVDAKLAALNSQAAQKSEYSLEIENLRLLKRHPDLLSKILILQEKFAEYYSKLIDKPRLLVEIEQGETSIDPAFDIFVKEQPTFSSRSVDPSYFLYSAGLTGFEHGELPDPSLIVQYARIADSISLQKSIQGATDVRRNEYLDSILGEWPNITEDPEKINIAKSFLAAINLVKERLPREEKLRLFLDKLKQEPQIAVALQADDIRLMLESLRDSDVQVEVAKVILEQEPFTQSPLADLIKDGFIAAKDDLSADSLEAFFNIIAVDLEQPDIAQQDKALSRLNSMAGVIDEGKILDSLSSKVLTIFEERPVTEKAEVWSVILSLKNMFSDNHNRQLIEKLTNMAASSDIDNMVFIISNLDTIKELPQSAKIMDGLVTRYKGFDIGEKRHVFPYLEKKGSLLSDENKRDLVNQMIEYLEGTIEQKELAFEFLSKSASLFPADMRIKRGCLNRLLRAKEHMSQPEIERLREIISTLNPIWESDKSYGQKFREFIEEAE